MEQALELSIGKIVSLVENQVSLLCEFQNELDEIKIELQYMQSFVQDSERRRDNLQQVEKTWVKIVRDTANEIVDIIDNFTYRSNEQRSWNKLYRSISLPKIIMERHKLAEALRGIKARLGEYAEMNKRYLVHRGSVTGGTSFRLEEENSVIRSVGESALHHKDDDLVGVEESKRELFQLLLNKDEDRSIVSVVGMGGSGKTTLAASVFRSHEVKMHFDRCCVWVAISQTGCTTEDLLRSLMKEFYKVGKKRKINAQEVNLMSRRELVEMLVNYLEKRRYLVVLDDVWEIDDLWIALRVALPSNGLGSRILLTTRKEDIAGSSFDAKSHIFSVKLLSGHEARELFWRKASPHRSDQCSRELGEIATSLVKKCGGLPLGLASLGALMSTKKLEVSEWKRVHDCLNWELSKNPRLVVLKRILWLSFHELPYRLKQCFIYCSIFPEDYKIRKGRLIRLWIAEGFVEQDKWISQEDMAESYVMELVRRCMLQVFTPIDLFHLTQAFKMHDLVRELAVSISEDEDFCTIYTGPQEVDNKRRLYRLSVQADYREGTYKDASKVRSLFIFKTDMVTSSSSDLLANVKLLKVLDLKKVLIVELPKNLTRCYNLTYLNLTGTQVETLPSDIGNLYSLQTLDIKHTKIKVLPEGIAKLSNLRHLMTFRYNYDNDIFHSNFKTMIGTRAPRGISELKNLQILESIEVEEGTVKQVGCLTQLKRIDLMNVTEADGKHLCILIERMHRLEYLALQTSKPDEALKIDEVSSASHFLKSLNLVGKLNSAPKWFGFLNSLKNLSLTWSRLSADFVPQIGKLPHLIVLRLINAYEGRRLQFLSGFESLEYLWLNNFPELDEIVIGEGVMPTLREMDVTHCLRLRSVPIGIERLNFLRVLKLRSVAEELVDRLSKDGGPDWGAVRHIPIIMHHRQVAPSDWVGP